MILTNALAIAFIMDPPPSTRKDPVTETIHGEVIVDDYRWLEPLEADSAEVEAWTTEQNEHTRQVLDALPCRPELRKELERLMSVGSISSPTMRGNLYFYRERSGTQNQGVLFLREGLDGEPRTLLDPNTLDENGLISLDWYVPSQDGELIAFGLSQAGDEMTTLHLMETRTGTWLSDEISGKASISGWAPDGKGFLYSKLEDPDDAYSRVIKWHVVGRNQRHDPTLFRQEEPSRIPFASLSKNGRWLLHGITDGWSRNDLWVANFDQWHRDGTIQEVEIAVGLEGRFRPIAVLGDTVWMSSTHEAPNGEVLAVDLNFPEAEHWKTIIPEEEAMVLRGVSHARGMLVARYISDAVTRFRKYRMNGDSMGELATPGLGSASLATEDDRTEAFMSYSSYNEPRTVYRVDLVSGERSIWARPDVPVDPDSVRVSQVFTESKDGTRVPYFLVHGKDVEPDGDNPCLIYGYGGFNISMEPRFISTYFPWFDAGGVLAVANLRGGGEYGESWHRAGMLESKQNVFDDLYAIAGQLISDGWTNPDRLAVMGGSNGGLLTGVAATQRPDLFACAISNVPLLDMIRYHQFLMARFWVPEYGSSEEEDQFEWLRAYSPYHNIAEGRQYPAMLITAGENDNRVHPLHARKMAARMQERAANDHDEKPILLWVDRDSGHGSGKPLELRIRDRVDTWAFIMWQTGLCR
ncbi:MAG: prolyl oligopeptidase family serine peptidase [Phycisphaerales bacterium]|nr:prolyl oligopeptidase family serine peptidase [Phycisphaerales bacterium]